MKESYLHHAVGGFILSDHPLDEGLEVLELTPGGSQDWTLWDAHLSECGERKKSKGVPC